jgi:V8-like Glu-specific endopeptidase
LDFGPKAFCTATLVAPDLILTAAHCVFDGATGRKIPVDRMQFKAGWRKGTALAYRDIARVVVHPSYTYLSRFKALNIKFDTALLKLARPISTQVVTPFDTNVTPAPGARIAVVSYAHDRAEAPALQPLCHILTLQDDALVTSCDIDFGSSGAPVFEIADGQARIVSIIAAKAQMNGLDVSLGTPLSATFADLMKELAGPVADVPGDPDSISWPSGSATRRIVGPADTGE